MSCYSATSTPSPRVRPVYVLARGDLLDLVAGQHLIFEQRARHVVELVDILAQHRVARLWSPSIGDMISLSITGAVSFDMSRRIRALCIPARIRARKPQ